MEQPCHSCGKPVDEGVAFCPNCNAPQIRVAGLRPEAFSEASPPLPPAEPSPPPSPARHGLHWGDAWRAAAFAGVLVSIASFFPLSYLLWVLLGGVLAVVLYRRRRPQDQFGAATGAVLGALTGLIGFSIFALGSTLLILARGEFERIREAMQQALQRAATEGAADPRAQEAMELLTTPGGLAFMIAVVVVVFLAAFVLFGAMGGAMGALVLGKRRAG